MKIKVIKSSYSKMIEEHRASKKPHIKPIRPNFLFRSLLKIVSLPDLIATKFKCERVGMDRLGKDEPAFFIMNHSSFIDLEIAASVLYPRHFNIVATTDGFIGKDWLMRKIGCIPTRKFVADSTMVRDLLHATKKLNNSIVMYPEAGYSFDGTATTMPDTLGKCVKLLGLPLVMIKTFGAYSRDPLYNNLQRRRVKVSARMEYLLSADEIKSMSDSEITKIIDGQFTFDSFAWQRDNQIKIDAPWRADGLNRVLYKCPSCMAEGKTVGKGIHLTCNSCGAEYTLDEYGTLSKTGGECELPHIPDWYRWEREQVREEIQRGEYGVSFPVKILAATDTKRLFDIGKGVFAHTPEGFTLTSEDGTLNYEQKSLASYTVNADFNWYEIGDIISIGDNECLFYCFPEVEGDVVAKIRLATEEIYKIARATADKAVRI